MREFDGIEGFDGWNKKLGELLKEAEKAARQDELEPRLQVSERLTQFIVHSSPNTPEIRSLDQIANQARSSLLRRTIEDRLESLGARRSDLASLTKQIEAQAEIAAESAASIRLETANKVVNSLTESVHSLKEFRNVLETGTDDELAASIDQIILSIRRLRNDVESRS